MIITTRNSPNGYVQTQGSRYRSPLSPFAQKNKIWHKKHKLAKISGEKKKSPELPATESFNCRACLSHLP